MSVCVNSGEFGEPAKSQCWKMSMMQNDNNGKCQCCKMSMFDKCLY